MDEGRFGQLDAAVVTLVSLTELYLCGKQPFPFTITTTTIMRTTRLVYSADDVHGVDVYQEPPYTHWLALVCVQDATICEIYDGVQCVPISRDAPFDFPMVDWGHEAERKYAWGFLHRPLRDGFVMRLVDVVLWPRACVAVVVDVFSWRHAYHFLGGSVAIVIPRPLFRHHTRWSELQACSMGMEHTDLVPASVVTASGFVRKWRDPVSGRVTKRRTRDVVKYFGCVGPGLRGSWLALLCVCHQLSSE